MCAIAPPIQLLQVQFPDEERHQASRFINLSLSSKLTVQVSAHPHT